MDWKQILQSLYQAGYSQKKLAEICGVSQSSVSALSSGVTRDPSYSFGSKLLELQAESAATRQSAAEV